MSASTPPATVSVAILGTDAALAARPATAIQLAHAVLAVGYDAVYPSSWGDEIVAAGCLQRAAERDGVPTVLCSCPLVAERLLRSGRDLERFLMPMVSPPVAVARYLRALYAGRPLHITYVGGCPDAACAEIDARLSPAELEAELRARGIVVTRQPQYFESVLPPDRRRFYSLPGGAPSPHWLRATERPRTLVTLAGEDLAAELAQTLLSGDISLIDAAPMLGCVCSGATADVGPGAAREEAEGVDPPRASSPVIDTTVPIELDRELPETGEDTLSSANDVDDATDDAASESASPEAPALPRADAPPPPTAVSPPTTPMNGGGRPGQASQAPEHMVEAEERNEGDDQSGEVIHSYSRHPHAPAAPGGGPAARVSVSAVEASTASRSRPHITLAQAADAFNIELALGMLGGVQHVPDAAEAGEIALPADLAPNTKPEATEPAADEPQQTETSREAPQDSVGNDDVEDDREPELLRATVRRITPASVRRIAMSTPVVRTGSGRAVPRAYAAHRRTPTAPRGDAPPEREKDIQLAFEPLAPPADFRPPIGERLAPAADLEPPIEKRPATPAAQPDVRAYARPLFLEPQRSRNWSRGVLVAAAIVALGVVSILAARYLTLRDEQRRLGATAVWERSGVIDDERGLAPAIDPVEVDAAALEGEPATGPAAVPEGEPADEPAAAIQPPVERDEPLAPATPLTQVPSPVRPEAAPARRATAAPPARAEELRRRQFDSIIRALDSQRVTGEPW